MPPDPGGILLLHRPIDGSNSREINQKHGDKETLCPPNRMQRRHLLSFPAMSDSDSTAKRFPAAPPPAHSLRCPVLRARTIPVPPCAGRRSSAPRQPL